MRSSQEHHFYKIDSFCLGGARFMYGVRTMHEPKYDVTQPHRKLMWLRPLCMLSNMCCSVNNKTRLNLSLYAKITVYAQLSTVWHNWCSTSTAEFQ